MEINEELDTYWISFPKDPDLPWGIGVTAISTDDAFQLIREQGIAEWFKDAEEVQVQQGIRFEDLDPRHIQPNIGPMQFRGVWYPARNTGLGAPRDAEYKPFSDGDA